MLKVLIADDDTFIRIKIKTLINWEDEGFQIVSEASNGELALDYAVKENVDIIITDMKMPIMDGAELIREIKRVDKKIEVIALSGFDDFEYVRQSLKFGAVDYVLKHQLDREKLRNILSTVKNIIEERKNKQSEDELLEELIRVNSRLEINNYFINILNGIVDDETVIKKQFEKHRFPFDFTNVHMTFFQIDRYLQFSDKRKASIKNMLLDLVSEVIGDYESIFFVEYNSREFLLIKNYDCYSQSKIIKELNEIIMRIKTVARRYLNINFSLVKSRILKDVKTIGQEFYNMKVVMSQKFYIGEQCELDSSMKLDNYSSVYKLEQMEEIEIYEYLLRYNEKIMEKKIIQCFSDIANSRGNISSVRDLCAQLIYIGNKIIERYGIKQEKSYITVRSIRIFDTIYSLRDEIILYYRFIISQIKKSEIKESYSDNIITALSYINSNFHLEISLSSTADRIGISRQYLSKKFKDECGMSFVDYLTNKRINYAKELLEMSKYSIGEIACKSGYHNYNYFLRVFKEKTGKTPNEYHRLMFGRV